MPFCPPLLPALLFATSVQAGEQATPPDTEAARLAQQIAPPLYAYTRDVLFADLWQRPQLAARDRSLVTLAALLANNQSAQMAEHIGLALDHGVSPSEIIGLITHLAFYSGWPNAMSALVVARERFAARGITPASLPAPSSQRLAVDTAAEARRAAAVSEQVAPLAPALARYTDEVLFAELWRQTDLTPRDRSLITVAALIARGQPEQLSFHLARAMDAGLTQVEAGEVVTQLAFYAGWPRAMSALPVLRTVFASRS